VIENNEVLVSTEWLAGNLQALTSKHCDV